MNPLSHYFNIFYLFVCIIWQPTQLYILKVDGAGRTILTLSVIAIVWNILSFWRQSHVLLSPAMKCWITLVLFSVANSIVKGYVSEWGALAFFQTNYITPFVFLYVLVLELDWNFEKCLKVLFWALLTYVFLAIGNMGIIRIGADDRFMAEGLGNLLPLFSTCLVFIGGILYTRQELSIKILIAIVAIAIVVTILSGTRKALASIVILLTGIFLHKGINGEERSVSFYIRFAILSAILYWGMGYLMNNTMIGERFTGTAEQSDVLFTNNRTVNLILNTLLGDRAIQYELGFLIYSRNPLTGIGITNFTPVTGFPFRLHTEYMVQLCENGIIGFSLLILFYFFLIKKLQKCHKESGEDITLLMFGIFTVLFLNITAWTYCSIFGMIYYGIFIAYAYSDDGLTCDDDDETEGLYIEDT